MRSDERLFFYVASGFMTISLIYTFAWHILPLIEVSSPHGQLDAVDRRRHLPRGLVGQFLRVLTQADKRRNTTTTHSGTALSRDTPTGKNTTLWEPHLSPPPAIFPTTRVYCLLLCSLCKHGCIVTFPPPPFATGPS